MPGLIFRVGGYSGAELELARPLSVFVAHFAVPIASGGLKEFEFQVTHEWTKQLVSHSRSLIDPIHNAPTNQPRPPGCTSYIRC